MVLECSRELRRCQGEDIAGWVTKSMLGEETLSKILWAVILLFSSFI